MLAGEFVALLIKLMFPLTAPAAAGANWTETGTDWPAVKVSPELTPLTVKPAPETFTADIVTLEFPVFVKAALKSLLLPTFTLPKLRLDVLNVSSCVPATPVPLNAIVRGELGALLVSEIEPVALPAVLGAKTALNVAFEPVGIVSGVVRPVMLKPVPVTVAREITTLAVPPFERLIVCELLFPVETFPKAAVPGTAPSCAWLPVPLKAMVNGELGALLAMEMLPLVLPGDVGENCAVKVALCPAAIVEPAGIPLTLKPAPAAVACAIDKLAVPPFVNVICSDPALPTWTLPKLKVAGLALSCACTANPLSGIVIGEPGALLATEMLPEALPAVVGANVAAKEPLFPGLIVTGMLRPLMLKPTPEALPWVIVNGAFPVFCKLMFFADELPTPTFP
jgi:hypothetical protein